MPIIRIEALVDRPPDVALLLEGTVRAAAEAFGTEPRQCWATFRELPSGTYLEGGRVRDSSEAALVSPLVTVLAYRGRTRDVKARVLAAVAEAVGRGLGTPPENVFVEYREIPEGHVFTGGEVH
ncbi:MAG: tautomerase family protein [Planctomycetes bacterium]|nr:tautomerase family protein [Planctomycetota bacterium]